MQCLAAETARGELRQAGGRMLRREREKERERERDALEQVCVSYGSETGREA